MIKSIYQSLKIGLDKGVNFTLYEWVPFDKFSHLNINGSETDFIETDEGFYFVSRVDVSINKIPGSKLIFLDKETNQTRESSMRIKFDAPFLFVNKKKKI